MRIIFLGVGAAFTTPAYYQSNMLLVADNGRKLLIDCGGDIRFALAEYGQDNRPLHLDELDAVYISHLHADHIGGLEWLAFSSYFAGGTDKIALIGQQELLHQLWQHSLAGGLHCIRDRQMTLNDYFRCQPVAAGMRFAWQQLRFELIRLPHVPVARGGGMDSFGLFIDTSEGNGTSLLLTSDTTFAPQLLNPYYDKADIIFHDCETALCKTSVHAHYDDLCRLPKSIRAKMWLYHYQPQPRQNPQTDGFRGFVARGQSFTF